MPDAGRFVSEDPIKSGDNWYSYCRNNPLIFFDPLGLSEICEEDIPDYYNLFGQMDPTLSSKTGIIYGDGYYINYTLSYEFTDGINPSFGSSGNAGYRFTGVSYEVVFDSITYPLASAKVSFHASGPSYVIDSGQRNLTPYNFPEKGPKFVEITPNVLYSYDMDSITYYDANLMYPHTDAWLKIDISFVPGGGRQGKSEIHTIPFLEQDYMDPRNPR
jgi:hypothetical protein